MKTRFSQFSPIELKSHMINSFLPRFPLVTTPHHRFTAYDSKKMHRRSYYPHNQQIVSQMTASSSIAFSSSRPVTPNDREHSESLHELRKSGPQGIAGMPEGREDSISMDHRLGVNRIVDGGINEVAPEQIGMNGYGNEKQVHS